MLEKNNKTRLKMAKKIEETGDEFDELNDAIDDMDLD